MSKRTYKSSPKGTVQTQHGEFVVTVNHAKAFYVETPEAGVNVRGVPVRGSEHWSLDEDGQWKGYYEKQKSQYSFSAKRLDQGQFAYADATPTMNKVVYEALRVAAVAFAEANPLLLQQAEAVSANNSIESADKKIAELNEQLNKLLTERGNEMARESSALAAVERLESEAAPRLR